MPCARPALRVVEIATGALNLAARSGLAGVVDDESALVARSDIILGKDPSGQFTGQAAPIDVLPAQKIVEHAHLA